MPQVDPRVIYDISSRLGPPARSGAYEYIFTCPVCNKAGHLYVNPFSKRFLCFKCDHFKGDMEILLKYLGLTISDKADISNWKEKIISFLYGAPTHEKHRVPCVLPDDCCKLLKDTDPWDYLIGRGLSEDDINYYSIGYSPSLARVIFPSYDKEGKLEFWCGRKVYDDSFGPPYLFPKDVEKRDKLYDIYRIRKHSDTLAIAEGVISAIITGRDCTCTYGKGFTEDQVSLMRFLGFHTYIIVYDGDTQKKIKYRDKLSYLDLAKYLLLHGLKDIRVVNFPYRHDPASMGKLKMEELLSSARRVIYPGIII